jgi:hypothetical protein
MVLNYDWMKVYEAAVLETDSLALPPRIEEARSAIAARALQDGLDRKKRQAIVDALNALSVLKRERSPHVKFAVNNN